MTWSSRGPGGRRPRRQAASGGGGAGGRVRRHPIARGLPLTTREREAPLLRVPVAPTAALPLAAPCWVMIDKITSVRRDRAREPAVGRVSDDELVAVNRGLAVFLGLG